MPSPRAPRRVFRSATALVGELVKTSPREAAGAAIGLLLLTVSEGAGLLLLAPLLELVGVVEESPLPRAGGWLASMLGALRLEPTLASVLALFVAIAAIRALVQRAQSRLAATMREDLTASYRDRIYRAMAGAEWRFLVTRKPSDFMHVMVNETGRIGVAASHLIDVCVAVMVALMYLALALRLSPGMAVLVLGSAALLGILVRGSLERARALGVSAAAQRVKLHGAIAEHVGAIKVAKSYGVTGRHTARVAALSQESRAVTLAVARGDSDLHRLLELGSTVLLALIVYVSSVMLNEPAALLLVMLFIFARLMPRLVAIYRHAQALASNLPVFDAVRALERECAAAAEPDVPAAPSVVLTRSIRFERVSFAYLGRTANAVEDIDLEIRAGETTAIVGPSGSGKSTVADLLLGLLTPSSGRILLDGVPLVPEHLPSWRAQTGYVPQDTFLFDDTVRANLLWAQPAATEADVWEALRQAAADTFVSSLPDGLDTIIGNRGVLLSGGERQRLSIARALLRRPRILVLDEATSSLDKENEARIQQAIARLHHRMTIVIITHRLWTIENADAVHVMEGGRVVKELAHS